MEKNLQSNVLVLREDIINTWKWTEEIKKEIETMKKRQNRLEKHIHNLTSLLCAKNISSSYGNILQTTDL